MANRKALISFLAAVICAFVTWADMAWAATHTITSLPYTTTTSNCTLYVSGTKLKSATDGVIINHIGTKLFLQGDTIIFGTDKGAADAGVRINASGATIEGGYILHGYGSGADGLDNLDHPAYDTLAGQVAASVGCTGIYSTLINLNNTIIRNVKFKVGGDNGQCIYIYANNITNNEISGNWFWDYSRRFFRRDWYMGHAIKIGSSTPAAGIYNARLFDNIIYTAPGGGMALIGVSRATGGRCRFWVRNNLVTVDGRNDYYTYPTGSAELGWGNAYGIMISAGDNLNYVGYNTIRSGISYGGGEGILYEGVTGTAVAPCSIWYNDINVNEGWDPRGYCHVYGIKLRYYNDTDVPCQGIVCKYNNVTVTADGDVDWYYQPYPYSKFASALAVVAADPNDAVDDGLYVNIENNRCIARNRGVGWAEVAAINLDAGYRPSVWDATHFIIKNNYFESDCYIVAMAGANYGSQNILLDGDTLAFSASPDTNKATIRGAFEYAGCNMNTTRIYSAYDNYFHDCIYLNGASPSDIEFTGLPVNTNSQEAFISKTLTVTIVGNNGLPVYAAACTVWNAYGTRVLTGTTDSLGQVAGPVTHYYGSRLDTDSTAYNPFSIHAQKGAEKITGVMTVDWDKGDTTLAMGTTAGTGFEERFSAIFLHRSVGGYATNGGSTGRHIREVLDTATVVVDNHYTRFVFDDLNLNLGGAGGYYDSANTSFLPTFPDSGWGWNTPNSNREKVAYQGSSPMLANVWQYPNKTTYDFWELMTDYYYDRFIVKNAYLQWNNPTLSTVVNIKASYESILDSIAEYPEIPFVFAFGTPYRVDPGANEGFEDTTEAKLIYWAACWFADTFDVSGVSNVSKWDSYRGLLELNPDSTSRLYGMDYEYWDGGSVGHPNNAGAISLQDSLIAFLRREAYNDLFALYGEAEPVDTVPPGIINLAASDITSSTATISWATGESTASGGDSVYFGATISYGSVVPATSGLSHSATLQGLASNSVYHYAVMSKDASGNRSISADSTFTTYPSGGDTDPPTQFDFAAESITSVSVVISWSTDENTSADSVYITGWPAVAASGRQLYHSAFVYGLAANTTYSYRVMSRDVYGNRALSSEYNFITLPSSEPQGGKYIRWRIPN